MKTQSFILSLLLCLLNIPQIQAYTERNLLQKSIASPDELKSLLILNQRWVPYPEYSYREEWKQLLKEHREALITQGEKALKHEWKVVKATDYLEFERSGNRAIMETPLGENNRALVQLFIAELAEGKGRFVDQLINGVFQACEMTSWSLSAHLNAQRSRRSLPDYKENIIDLTSGDMGSLLSWVYYYFHTTFDKINPAISERLAFELRKRILDPYMNEDRFWWMAVNYKPGKLVNNWNPWCNSNALQCFLLLENDPDKLAAAIHRSMVSVDKFLNYTHSDGACEEGPSYWGHAAGKLYDYLQLLSLGTGGKVSLFDQQIVRNMGEYIARSYVGNGWVVNFADASAKGGGEAPLIYRFGKAVDSDLMKSYASYLNGKLSTEERNKEVLSWGRDIFRGLESFRFEEELNSVQTPFEVPSYSWYPETEFCYMASKGGLYFAAKGGYNNESHNHNDAGSFSLWLHTQPVIIDAGVGTYTRQTFSSERYSIWTMQGNYHNLPMINGVPQQFGSRFKATEVQFNPKKQTFSAQLATAYPEQAHVADWVRTYKLTKEALHITDTYRLTEVNDKNRINFMSWGEIDNSTPGKVKIKTGDAQVVLEYNKQTFDTEIETIPLSDPRLSTVWGAKIYRISLVAKESTQSGTYTYIIKKL